MKRNHHEQMLQLRACSFPPFLFVEEFGNIGAVTRREVYLRSAKRGDVLATAGSHSR